MKPIERLEVLNQFMPADLRTYNGNLNKYVGRGLINGLNGCFVAPVIVNDEYDHNGLRLIWHAQNGDNTSHEVILDGEALEKYIRLMEMQSENF